MAVSSALLNPPGGESRTGRAVPTIADLGLSAASPSGGLRMTAVTSITRPSCSKICKLTCVRVSDHIVCRDEITGLMQKTRADDLSLGIHHAKHAGKRVGRTLAGHRDGRRPVNVVDLCGDWVCKRHR